MGDESTQRDADDAESVHHSRVFGGGGRQMGGYGRTLGRDARTVGAHRGAPKSRAGILLLVGLVIVVAVALGLGSRR